MIGIFDDDGNRLAVTYNGLTFNNPNDSADETYELNSAGVFPSYDQTLDSDPATDGSEVGPVKRTLLTVQLAGVIRSTSIAGLFEKQRALIEALDPGLLSYKDETDHGVQALDFKTPTTDTSNYPTGLVASRYLARPRGGVWPVVSEYTGTSAFFSVELIVPSAIRISQSVSSLSGAGTLDNSLADAPYWPTVTITMAGAGSATYTITRTGTYSTKSIVLDLSGRSNGQIVTIDMKNKRVLLGSAETTTLYVSGDWWEIEPNSQTIGLANTTNATTSTAWRRAWPA
jgi:hypothetical protein